MNFGVSIYPEKGIRHKFSINDVNQS